MHKIAGLCCIFPLSFFTFCLEMTKGAKIFAVVITTIIFIELLVVIILLATHGHDDETGMYN